MGYDYYAPAKNVLFHHYNRKNKPKLFWENSNNHHGTRPRSARRIRTIMQCDDEPDPKANLYEIEKYGLGTERKIEWFYLLFDVDCKNNLANDHSFSVCDGNYHCREKGLCHSVLTGEMHEQYSQYLPESRLGIDYSQVPEIVELEKSYLRKVLLSEDAYRLYPFLIILLAILNFVFESEPDWREVE